MSLSDRIQERMKALLMTEMDLARKSGIPQPTIHRTITGEIKNPRFQNIEKLARALNIDIYWLWKGESQKASHSETERLTQKEDDNTISIPLVDVENNHHYNMIIGIDMDKNAIKKLISCKDYNKLSGICMPDDSMNKTINNGDPMLVDENYKTIDIDGIYKIEYGNKTYIRRFQASPSRELLMIADNENYKDFTINVKEIKVIGKIVYVWTGKRI